MRHEELLYVLALLKAEGIGDATAKKLISRCGSAEAVFKTPLSQLKGIGKGAENILRKLNSPHLFIAAEAELKFIESNCIQTAYFLADNYPERLKHCFDGPILLFSKGNIDYNNRKIISVVGTRQVTPHGAAFCRQLISDLAPLDPIIVSGFAFGVDIVAHQAALEQGLQTIAVVAHGLDLLYPKAHQKYLPQLQENGGLLTEFCSGTPPEKENFIRRNRIVAGISEATIVIESAEKGGSLITANRAFDYNRDVFAVPGRVTDKYSQGCLQLIQSQKAQLLSSAADLVYHLNWELNSPTKAVQKQLFVELNSDEQQVYDYLLTNGKEELDFIAMGCALPIYKLSGLLLTLELKGVIRPLPGKLFEAI
ncbi:MAG: DNA-protecting protein DprA [Flavobacterium sp.]|nr:DNA-protecting protein DprA [Flavobacterium sp.]